MNISYDIEENPFSKDRFRNGSNSKSSNLSCISNSELENNLRQKTFEERKLTLEIIELLHELDRRKLYLERGYGSLIEYCVKELKYSESSAYRRISAMRLVRDLPETKSAIQTGALNLATVAQAQTFFRAEAKLENQYSIDEKKELLSRLENKSTRAAEKMLVALSPQIVPKEKVRPVNGEQSQMTLIVSEELLEKLEKLKNLLSHKSAGESYAEVIEHAVDLALEKLDLTKLNERKAGLKKDTKSKVTESDIKVTESDMDDKSCNAQPAPVLSVQATSRYIPAELKREVWRKSQGRCSYRDSVTKRQCSSRRYLEIDHITPVAKGGQTTADNLQLLCDGHNRWKGARLLNHGGG